MLASCFPTAPRGAQPSSLSICSITFLRIPVAAERGWRGLMVGDAS
jgi:hypothetical protein